MIWEFQISKSQQKLTELTLKFSHKYEAQYFMYAKLWKVMTSTLFLQKLLIWQTQSILQAA